MHIYQKHILDLLRGTSSLRYTQLQPDGVESSHFKYHLNQLLTEGLVEQQSRGVYALTTKGKTTVDRLSKGKVNPNLTPKVITYTLLKDSSNYYLQRKDKEPYLGLVNMIGGKVHIGEGCADAAKREIYEKTGQEINKVDLQAIAEIRISTNGSLLSHVIAYIYYAELASAIKQSETLTKIPFDQLKSRDDLAPDLLKILDATEASNNMHILDLSVEYENKAVSL